MIEERVKRENRIKEVEVTAYRTSDGSLFLDKDEAERHENGKETRYYQVGIYYFGSPDPISKIFEVVAKPNNHIDVLCDFINFEDSVVRILINYNYEPPMDYENVIRVEQC